MKLKVGFSSLRHVGLLSSLTASFALLMTWRTTCQAQEFRLSAAELGVSSTAVLTESRLEIVDGQGKVNLYDRDVDFDSDGGQWLGYRNRQSGRVLLWPSNNSGHFQIGSVERGVMRFSQSKMLIQAIGTPAKSHAGSISPSSSSPGTSTNSPGVWQSFAESDLFSRIQSLPIQRLPESQPVYMVSTDASGSRCAFAQRGAKLGCVARPNPRALWWVAPVGQGIIRLQAIIDGRVWAVSAVDRRQIRLSLLSNDPRQCWRLNPSFQHPNLFCLESAFFSGTCLTGVGLGDVHLRPFIGSPTQLWAILTPPATEIAILKPFWRSVRREVQPNPPIPPAEVELQNTHSAPLIVLVGDPKQNLNVETVRVETGSSSTITIQRDPGATLVETVEVLTPLGDWSRQEFVTQIPASYFIDLSVYEEFLQSIAIDRTGKSPQKIEDVNYVPRSIGLVLLSGGSDLSEASRIDVYSQAVAAGNPGAVRRLRPDLLEKPAKDPVQSILERELGEQEVQSADPPDGRRSF